MEKPSAAALPSVSQPLNSPHLIDDDAGAAPIFLLSTSGLAGWMVERSTAEKAWITAAAYDAAAGATLLVPDAEGGVAAVLVGIEETGGLPDLWALAGAPRALPVGRYRLGQSWPAPIAGDLALGWALGTYAFDRYKAPKRAAARLVWPADVDRPRVLAAFEALSLARDLINTPAGDLGPDELALAAGRLAARHDATCRVIRGEDLIAHNYPAVHAVGRASDKPPCLIDIAWGDANALKVTLVGKGVCFDSGGLDLKPSSNMLLMKKDMGGAAAVLATAHMVMAAKLPVRLRVLIPAVENMISGNAFRPLDVLSTRAGKSVEVGNTDAEGRLILADALTEAATDQPGLLIDCATLTGAARVALGPEVPAFFTRHDALADSLSRHGAAALDPLWRLPLWPGYRRLLDSKVADLHSTGESPQGGAITAALFLAEFVPSTIPWIHIDMMAWNNRARPGRPEGGEAQGARALFRLIEEQSRGA